MNIEWIGGNTFKDAQTGTTWVFQNEVSRNDALNAIIDDHNKSLKEMPKGEYYGKTHYILTPRFAPLKSGKTPPKNKRKEIP